MSRALVIDYMKRYGGLDYLNITLGKPGVKQKNAKGYSTIKRQVICTCSFFGCIRFKRLLNRRLSAARQLESPIDLVGEELDWFDGYFVEKEFDMELLYQGVFLSRSPRLRDTSSSLLRYIQALLIFQRLRAL